MSSGAEADVSPDGVAGLDGGEMQLTPAQLEDAKNMALLFFMDHLITKNGQRTIHDLSCQFGARGFTPEMRAAVGGTQESLTSFLSQFPSLFKIENDEVSINHYGDMGGSKVSGPMLQDLSKQKRDYEQEAVDFFEMKLRKFGPELQIKSLLGHRSQAAPEVRLISGRHLKDFADFLASHPESFVVSADRVRLARMPEPDDRLAALDDVTGEVLQGARAKSAAVDYLKGVLEQNADVPMPLDTLYQRFCMRFPHIVRQDVATNPKELLQFLKLNRCVFFIRSNKVSLVKNRPPMGGDNGGGSTGDDESNVSESDGGRSLGPSPAFSPRLFPPQLQAHLPGPPALNRQPSMVVVKSLKHAQMALTEILQEDISIDGPPVLALDCKFVSLGPNTPDFLSLVVLGAAAGAGTLVVFDVAHSDTILLESGLRDVLQSDDVLKVMHDCRGAASTLRQRYNIQLRRVYDTQVRYRRLLGWCSWPTRWYNTGGTTALSERFVLSASSTYNASDNGPGGPRRVEVNWAHRPIGDDMLAHITEQAQHLVPALYLALRAVVPMDCVGLLHALTEERLACRPDGDFVPPPNAPNENVEPRRPHSTPGGLVAQFNPAAPPYVPPLPFPPPPPGFLFQGGPVRPPMLLPPPRVPAPSVALLQTAAAGGGGGPTPTKSKPLLNGVPLGGGDSTPTKQSCCPTCGRPPADDRRPQHGTTTEVGTQTLSTGDITMNEIYYDRGDKR